MVAIGGARGSSAGANAAGEPVSFMANERSDGFFFQAREPNSKRDSNRRFPSFLLLLPPLLFYQYYLVNEWQSTRFFQFAGNHNFFLRGGLFDDDHKT